LKRRALLGVEKLSRPSRAMLGVPFEWQTYIHYQKVRQAFDAM
jgi:hypothetical protein